jgi:AraC-like DNA-binding protein
MPIRKSERSICACSDSLFVTGVLTTENNLKKYLTLSGAIIFFLISSPSAFPATIHIDNTMKEYHLGLQTEFLEDESGKLSITDISSKQVENRWAASNDINPGFGFTNSVIWARFTIANDTGQDIPFYFEHGYPLVDNLELYNPQLHGGYTIIKTGDSYAFSKRPVVYRTFVFPFVSEAKSIKTYYLRQKTSSAMNFPLTLWSPDEFQKMSVNEDRLLMFYYGMMAIMVINYLFVYLLIRHLSYLNFALYIASILLFIMTQVGATFQFLMPNNPGLASICPPFFLCMVNLFGNRFITVFLQLKKNAPVFKRIMNILAVVFLVAMGSIITIPLFGQYIIIMIATAYLSVVTIILAFIIGVHLTIRKQRSAYIFTIISFGFLCGSILYLLKSFGVLPGSFATTWSIVIGSATILIFLSIAMVDRINTLRKGLKIVSQNLEKQVKERSIELLLTEAAAKVMERAGGKNTGAEAEKINSPAIQNLLDHQRDLTINKLSQDISIISNMEELLGKATSKIMEISRARKVYLFFPNDSGLELRSFIDSLNNDPEGYSFPIVDEVYEKGVPVVTSTSKDAVREVPAGAGPGDENRSVVSFPIISERRIIGVWYLERAARYDPFTEKEMRVFSDFSNAIMPAFENALLYRKKMLVVDDKYKFSITTQTEEKIKQAIAYIDINYTSDISRENLAASLDISPNHLGKFFKVHTGKKINEYINELRISDAARKLREQVDENIINIAFSVGFESLSTFNRAFLKVMGVTPTEYKDKNKM